MKAVTKSKEMRKLVKSAEVAGQEHLTLNTRDITWLLDEAQQFKNSAMARLIWDTCAMALADAFGTTHARVKRKKQGSGDNLKAALYWTMNAMGLKKTQIAEICQINISGVGRACKHCLEKMREDPQFHNTMWSALEKAREKLDGSKV